jgi:hypothetical protein
VFPRCVVVNLKDFCDKKKIKGENDLKCQEVVEGRMLSTKRPRKRTRHGDG